VVTHFNPQAGLDPTPSDKRDTGPMKPFRSFNDDRLLESCFCSFNDDCFLGSFRQIVSMSPLSHQPNSAEDDETLPFYRQTRWRKVDGRYSGGAEEAREADDLLTSIFKKRVQLALLLAAGDTPDPEQASRLPAVWVEDEDCDVGKDMALRNNKDLID